MNSSKTDRDGQVLSAKSLVVARWFRQWDDNDFLEVVSPTVASATSKIILRVAVG